MVRASLLAALLLALAACSRDGALEPFAESQVPATLTPRFYPPEGWAWGFIGVGDKPVQRYGVASTRRVPTAIVVIVPGYGETAEMWFETASDLIGAGRTVWVLDRAGQGGSGRYVGPRDLGHVPSFDPDVAALRELVRIVIRPSPDTPLVILSHADGVVVALSAVRAGMKVDGVVASSPRLARSDPARRLLGAVRRSEAAPAGWKPWTRETADDRAGGATHDIWRGLVGQAWRTTNPDLRMSGPSLGWTKAYEVASRLIETGARQTRTEVVMINATGDAEALCANLPSCRTEAIPGAGAALHLEADRWRAPWLTDVEDFIATRLEARRMVAVSADQSKP
ncbi:MAG: alpha/beta hydrolase [Pseudomonadota bacterium]|uniref:alpha/beta hydrolase n=1 Tax=Phenylobacterium sp. TaxID=1871053 RepID=UPI0025D07C83|nr:alpha/beta hydrolase [Phenylobacterium sp.]MBT9473133.1 alpha/beta hydrolase [Phenylobacterium sp.]